APAVYLLVTALGKLVPDPSAQAAAKVASERVVLTHACVTAADKLVSEIDVFKSSAKAAHVDNNPPEEPDPNAQKRKTPPVRGKAPPKEKEPDVAQGWAAAQPSIKLSKQLAPCRVTVEAALGAKADLSPTWDAIAKVAEINTDKADQLASTRQVLK